MAFPIRVSKDGDETDMLTATPFESSASANGRALCVRARGHAGRGGWAPGGNNPPREESNAGMHLSSTKVRPRATVRPRLHLCACHLCRDVAPPQPARHREQKGKPSRMADPLVDDFLSERVRQIGASGIRRAFDLANRSHIEDLISLGLGEPDFDTPAFVKDAAKRAIDQGLNRYTTNAGIPALREAIAQKLARDNGVSYDPETEVIVTVGGINAIHLAILSTINPGPFGSPCAKRRASAFRQTI
ncbi:MAG: aminotransferase class I/II-fold pyridoxal phosphate-dependent enzyme [Proteobacteria bacterium]|nr:aminotransferase class I/II-fold pyridoxal phosphate-dependent enzyme [Pseudomonadota bacterium]